MEIKDAIQVVGLIFALCMIVIIIDISISIDEIKQTINETNENCIVVNEEIYCKK